MGWKRLKNKSFIQEQKQEVQAGNDKNLDGKNYLNFFQPKLPVICNQIFLVKSANIKTK